MKKALITGITGQDGSYLAELLLEKGYEVHGIVRRASSFNRERLEHLSKFFADPLPNTPRLDLHYADLSDGGRLRDLINKIEPDEVYNLGAQSHVGISFEIPEYTAEITGVGTLKLLEAIRQSKKKIKFYQASSSEMFGKAHELPLKETSPFHPRSPYGCAKVYAYWITKNYRESYGIFASNGILFNHESPRRGENFVTKKITLGLSEIKLGIKDKIYLGNLDAKRDWGYAKDYVYGMWLMLQQKEPGDYVLATNKTFTVRDFVNASAKALDMNIIWKGKGLNEKCIDQDTGKTIIEINKNYIRPAEVDVLLGDYSKAKKELGWKPTTTFTELVKIMTNSDYEKVKKELSQCKQ